MAYSRKNADRPESDDDAAASYTQAVRSHPLLVAVVTLAALAASLAWSTLRVPDYEASAQILVTPLPQDDRTFLGLQVLRDSNDPTRTVQTAATLIASSPQAAQLTARRLGGGWNAQRVLDSVVVEPEGQSNILAVTATTGDARMAARLANEFARSTLQARSETLRRQVQNAIVGLEARLKAVGGDRDRGGADTDLAERLDQLEAFREGSDPTLSLSQAASPPAAAAGAPTWLVAVLSLLAGFTLGSGTALLVELRNPRVRDEQDALSVYPLPLLTRVPELPDSFRRGEILSPLSTPPAAREAFRTLQVQLDQADEAGPRALMVTSASTGEGKTTCAVNLAFALVSAGHRVILMDLDLRKPDVGKVLGLESERGLVSLINSGSRLPDLLVQPPQVLPLRVAAASEGDVILLEALTRKLPEIIAEAKELADYVILDTSPLGEVSDALTIAGQVDDVLLVMRPGQADRRNLELVRDLLERSGRRPLGAMLVGGSAPAGSPYYSYGLARSNGGGGGSPPLARLTQR